MIAGAIPFVAYMKFLDGQRTIFLRDPQVRSLLVLLAGVSLVLGLWHATQSEDGLGQSIIYAAFNVVSVVTTTGFASTDYTAWGSATIATFFVLTFLGGCTGSTSGGVKTYRILVLFQVVRRHLMLTVMPSRVVARTFDGRRLERGRMDRCAGDGGRLPGDLPAFCHRPGHDRAGLHDGAVRQRDGDHQCRPGAG